MASGGFVRGAWQSKTAGDKILFPAAALPNGEWTLSLLFKASKTSFDSEPVQRILTKCSSATDCDFRISALKDGATQKLELTFFSSMTLNQQTQQADVTFRTDFWHQVLIDYDF